jgi:hypothetical protein
LAQKLICSKCSNRDKNLKQKEIFIFEPMNEQKEIKRDAFNYFTLRVYHVFRKVRQQRKLKSCLKKKEDIAIDQ